ncbi:uncharacterized protein LOC112270112 [Brachypodium distachyon]|uniref:uncharacterized protein LOC112270112 n=1 Tax=Brachypodium distachyon TaxID=15368 RepID=UPI000D0D12F4|nr:uncharacterized protein LOC112270112 [Brachypodium distachyon]|eukprot:XP_024313589.1 uncharacterized protein LOC112270112 [Brachypodium distachyon]
MGLFVKMKSYMLESKQKESRTSVPLASRQSHQLQRVIEENGELKVANQGLVQKLELHDRLILEILKDMDKEPPAWLGTNLLPTPQGTPISSRVVSQGAQSNIGGDLEGLEVMAHKDGGANMVDEESNHDLVAEQTDGNNSNNRSCGGTKGSNNPVQSPDK